MAADSRVIFGTELDESGLKNGLSKLGASSQGLLSGLGASLGMMATTMAAGVVAGLSQMVGDSIATASRLQEVQNVVDVTFGDSASSINEWAKSAKDAYGMGELKAKQYTSTIGAMFKSMGLASSATLAMSKGIGGLTGDMASFYNLDYDEAFEKLRAGISGETEPLKQLGINMSVANLEAFALSQGIKKSYEKMSQAEQVTLRYNYLMQATSDAQGDFARTSDGYANQQRILATTQEELAATIGEVLMPVAIEATKILNGLIGGLGDAVKWVSNLLNPPKSELDKQVEAAKKAVDDFNGAVATAGKNLDTSLATAKATQATALSLLKNYEAIQSKNVLTEQDTVQLRTIARQIVDLYPDMGKEIDSATGLFNINTTAVKDNITAMADQQKAMAYYAATQEYQAALINASVIEQMAADSYKTAYDNWRVDADTLDSVKQLGPAISDNADAMTQYAGLLISLNPAFAEWFDITADGTYALNDLGRAAYEVGDASREYEVALGVAAKAEQETSAAAAELEINLNNATEGTAKATDAMLGAQKAFADSGEVLAPLVENTEDLADANDKAGRHFHAVTAQMKAERDAAVQLKAELKKLSDDTIAQIKAQIDGFEKIKKVRPKSAKSTTKDVNSQTKFIEDYAANFKKAQENGVSAEALADLSEVTDENAAILAGLAKASDTEITNFNAAIEARNTERATLATQLSDFLTALVTANTTLDDSVAGAEKLVTPAAKPVIGQMAKIVDDGKSYADSIKQSATDAAGAKDKIKTSATEAQDAVSGMVTGIATIVDDNAETLLTAGAEITGEVANGVAKNRAIETVLRGQVVRGIGKARTEASAGNSVGEAIVKGIGVGAQSKGNWLNNLLAQIVRDALAAARNAGEVNSPSKLFARELGSPIAEGIGYGFSKTMDGVTSNIVRAISASAQAGKAALDNTLLGRVQAMAGVGYAYPSPAQISAATLKGAVYAGGGSVQNAASTVSTVDARQYITFERAMQAPDEIARAIRKNNTYGLAGARV